MWRAVSGPGSAVCSSLRLISAISAGGMPMPRSATSMSRPWSCACAKVNFTSVSGGEARSALSSSSANRWARSEAAGSLSAPRGVAPSLTRS
ncbi:Uncharacterised protein [Mycobacteroides abscessus subsp. abscessus]|nr:Uncharacterised protein [Mycobacteroides abscessus subsp. abscessus]